MKSYSQILVSLPSVVDGIANLYMNGEIVPRLLGTKKRIVLSSRQSTRRNATWILSTVPTQQKSQILYQETSSGYSLFSVRKVMGGNDKKSWKYKW